MALGEEACPRGLDAIMHGRDTSGAANELDRVDSVDGKARLYESLLKGCSDTVEDARDKFFIRLTVELG